ncbi:protein mono-ADP-ribosyltransferase PARP12, partial [Embiotoca jacksoni]|uniref:protein mono-ADP-ribosyltransferase PARP12 n=1 Tax=Embiotoca jacksoni TaxID=100190 RepID=UPI0037048912
IEACVKSYNTVTPPSGEEQRCSIKPVKNSDTGNVSEVISDQERFVSCFPNGQPKVVARIKLRLCRHKDCEGTCRGLHLCKNYLFSGSCHYRGNCCFCHDLNSDYNQSRLREHNLESLSRAELCTLLLQSDFSLLPAICNDYNNGDGEFGRCKEGHDCERLHICEKVVVCDCSCFRNHNFTAPQLLRNLRKKAIPNHLFHTLRFIYANRQALRVAGIGDDRAHRGNRGNRGGRGGRGNRGNRGGRGGRGGRGNHHHEYYNSSTGEGEQCNRGRGRGGYRGNRGNSGTTEEAHGLMPEQRASSLSDFLANIDNLDLYSSGGPNAGDDWQQQLNSSNSDVSTAANDTDASSESGDVRKRVRHRNRNKSSEAVRGRSGSRGNRDNYQHRERTRSPSDIFAAVNGATGDDGSYRRQRPVRDKNEICMYFIKGYCKHEEKCFRAHDKMPYRWQVQEGDQWTALPGNETIEKDYCDPSNTYSSGSLRVHFDTMTSGPNKVRRLSTLNSLIQPNYIQTTEWVWYWEDESGKWNMYASDIGAHSPADMNSAKLEQKFLDNDKDVVEFTAGSQSYSLSFQDMIQTNNRYTTKRLVRRRPRFASAADVKTRKVRPLGQQNTTPIPEHWDKTRLPQTGFSRIPLQRTSEEFKQLEALFRKTTMGFDVVQIERIQNKPLWEVFQWQKNQMKNKNGGREVTEKKLFHGTDSKYLDAICLNNFDWRICGTHGTAYGKGSYFARDAKYSHNYTGDTDVKTMFISRVLVGSYTKGSSDYRRPPSKDGGDINFFDSCVDNTLDPSIFVVFEKHQIYPEYLLHYKTTHLLVDLHSAAPVPAPRPVPATITTLPPKPAIAPKPVIQPGTSSYPYSTVSSRSSSSLYQSRSSSYQPSTPSYSSQPSTPSYSSQPSQYSPRPAAKKQSDSCVIA